MQSNSRIPAKHLIFGSMLAIALSLPLQAIAQIIDFGTAPSGGSPTDNSQLGVNDAYSIGSVDVTFGFDTDGNGTVGTEAEFEQAGDADAQFGFQGSSGNDTADPGFEDQLGSFFLRPPDFSDFGIFVIKYSGTGIATAASGEIWDLDGTVSGSESFVITAIDKDGNATALPSPVQSTEEPFDGRPWTFSFSGITAGIARIEIDFTGTKTNNIGLVFDNFDALGVTVGTKPLPALSHAKRIAFLAVLLATGFVFLRARTRTVDSAA